MAKLFRNSAPPLISKVSGPFHAISDQSQTSIDQDKTSMEDISYSASSPCRHGAHIAERRLSQNLDSADIYKNILNSPPKPKHSTFSSSPANQNDTLGLPRNNPPPLPFRGNAHALFKLSRAAKRDIEGWIHGQYAGVAKVGHELTKPTGEKFVFFLSLEEEEEDDADEEDDSGLQLSPRTQARICECIEEEDADMSGYVEKNRGKMTLASVKMRRLLVPDQKETEEDSDGYDADFEDSPPRRSFYFQSKSERKRRVSRLNFDCTDGSEDDKSGTIYEGDFPMPSNMILRRRFEAKYGVVGNAMSSYIPSQGDGRVGMKMEMVHRSSSLRNEVIFDEEGGCVGDEYEIKVSVELFGIWTVTDDFAQIAKIQPFVGDESLHDDIGFLLDIGFQEDTDGSIYENRYASINYRVASEVVEDDAGVRFDEASKGSVSCPNFPSSAVDGDGQNDMATEDILQHKNLSLIIRDALGFGSAHYRQNFTVQGRMGDQVNSSYFPPYRTLLTPSQPSHTVPQKHDEELSYHIPQHPTLRSSNVSSKESLNPSLLSSVFSNRTSLTSKTSYESVSSSYSRLIDALDLEVETHRCGDSCPVCTLSLLELGTTSSDLSDVVSNGTNHALHGAKLMSSLSVVHETPREDAGYDHAEEASHHALAQDVFHLNGSPLRTHCASASPDRRHFTSHTDENSTGYTIMSPESTEKDDTQLYTHTPVVKLTSANPPSCYRPPRTRARFYEHLQPQDTDTPERDYTLLFNKLPPRRQRHYTAKLRGAHEKMRNASKSIAKSAKSFGRKVVYSAPVALATRCFGKNLELG